MDGKFRVERVRHLSLPVPTASCGDTEDELTPILGSGREQRLPYFKHRHILYLYGEAEGRFLRLQQWERGRSFDFLHDQSMGLSSDKHKTRLAAEARHQAAVTLALLAALLHSLILNGRNEINVPVKPLYALFVDEVRR